MSLRRMLHWLKCTIVIFAVASSTWLYLYPIFNVCAFPSTNGSTRDGFRDTLALHRHQLHEHAPSRAPLRLLVLADPQLEGDSSLPDPEDALTARAAGYYRRLQEAGVRDWKETVGSIVKELLYEDIPRSFWAARKTLDLFGNDYYLAHIYRTLHWWTKPTHVTVLGDLIGSQWVSDDEFEWRGWRYWNRVLAGAHPVEEEIMSAFQQDPQSPIPLESDDSDWSRKIINIVGNHDIGYAGDISPSRIDRFERVFGRVNWDVHFSYPEHRLPVNHSASGFATPSLHLIVLNSMILDTPVMHESVQQETYNYLNGLIGARLDPVEDRNTSFTLLLTHIPLQKPEGNCVDAPFFDFWDYEDANGAFNNGGLKEQNHLSEHTSQTGILQGIFGMSGNLDANAGGLGRHGLVLNGHDHEGCDSIHYIERTTNPRSPNIAEFVDWNTPGVDGQEDPILSSTAPDTRPEVSWSWKAAPTTEFKQLKSSPIVPGDEVAGRSTIVTSLREITLRSMMGEYSGNVGLLSIWYDFDSSSWEYEVQMCPLGVQHIWWAIHITDLVAIGIALLEITTFLSSFKLGADTAKAIQPERSSRRTTRQPVRSDIKRVLQETQIAEGRSSSQRRRKG